MEENTIDPTAGENLEPQHENSKLSEETTAADAKESVTAASTLEEVSDPETVETSEKEVSKSEEKPSVKETQEVTATEAEETNDADEEDQDEDQEEDHSDHEDEEEDNFNKLSAEQLISEYRKISQGEHWFRKGKTLKSIDIQFQERFQEAMAEEKEKFISEGGNEIDFYFKPDYKTQFVQLSYEYRQQKRKHFKEQEAQQKVNLERRRAIIEEIKKLINVEDNINSIYKQFKALQESWHDTGAVPRAESQNLWETYKHHVERFYDFLHLNRELREIDFKHNYDEKLKIIEKAEALVEHPDIIKASRDLNALHNLWKNDLGLVAKEHREALWNRFQEATKTIQKRKQEYQKDRVGAIKNNIALKTQLLTQMKTMMDPLPSSHKAWQGALRTFNELRENFKNVGYIPSKDSKESWREFREISKEFMQQKNIFYKNQKNENKMHIDAKRALIAKLQQFIDAEDWNQKAGEVKGLQKQWKTVGFIPRKIDNKLWKEFSDLNTLYFDRLKSGYKKMNPEEETLVNQKNEFLKAMDTLKATKTLAKFKSEIEQKISDWTALGNLKPYLDEPLNKDFQRKVTAVIDASALKAGDKIAALEAFKLQWLENDPSSISNEMNALRSKISGLKGELSQLENNLAFFSNSSANNPMFKSVENKIEACKTTLEEEKNRYIKLKQLLNSYNKKTEATAEEEANEES